MKRNLILGLMLVLVMMRLAIPVSASENDGDAPVQENAVNAYEELVGSFPVSKNDSCEINYPDYYGGAYINEEGKLVVYVCGSCEEAKSLLQGESIVVESGEYSYNELLGIMDVLNEYKNKYADNDISRNFNEFGLYDSRNRIIVKLDDLSAERILEFKENVCDSEAIIFEQGFGPAKAEVNVLAGSEISYSGGSASLGYRVKRNGVVGFVTAGHAANYVGKSIKYSGTTFASCQATQQSGNADAGFCAITNSNYTLTNTLSGTSNTLSTTISEPGVGTTINKIGKSTGHTTGEVLATNVTATFDTGNTISNLTTASYGSAAGDSGCAVYSYVSSTGTRFTLGIHTGASNDGVTRYYTKANEVNSALGTVRY